MDNAVQIRQLSGDISYLSGRIQANNEKITRLQGAKSDIIGNQGELSSQKKLVNQPDLSSEMWEGKHAQEFINNRETIEQEYTNIMNTQVEALIDNIATEITQLQEQNSGYSSSIESKRYQISNLK